MTIAGNTQLDAAMIEVGALLVRVAKLDFDYAALEIARIDRLFMQLLSINPIEAAKLRAQCEHRERDLPADLDPSSVAQLDVSAQLRERIVTALWQVSLADGVVKDEECAFVSRVSDAFGIDKNAMDT